MAPDGPSTLITRGLLNLTHWGGHEEPAPLEPGKRYPVTVPLRPVGYAVAAGHRLRLAVSSTYWPFAWPSPEPVTLTVFTGAGSRLVVPVRTPRAEDADLAPFAPPATAPTVARTWLRTPTHAWTASRDLTAGRHETAYRSDGGRWRLEKSGAEWGRTSNLVATIADGQPLSAQIRCEGRVELAEAEWRTRVDVTSVLSSDLTTFRVTVGLDAYEADVRVFARTWNLAIPRDLL